MKFHWSIFISVIIMESLAAAQELTIMPLETVVQEAEGNSVVFTCFVSDGVNQQYNLQWYGADNQLVHDTGRIYVEVDGDSTLKLYIDDIKETDAGDYTCRGNIGGPVEKKVQLILYKDITFDNAPTSQHPIEGEDGLVICRVSGRPSPTVTWKFRQQKIDTGGRYVVKPLEGLVILNVSEQTDNGVYSCRAEVRKDGRIKTQKIQVIVHKKPKILQELGTTVGVEHQEVSIECKASGLPSPRYEFFRIEEGGNETPVSATSTRIIDENAGAIHFKPLNRGDEANYICRAINSAGQVESRGFLDVQIPPKIFNYHNVTGIETKSAKLICYSEGNPDPEMTFRNVYNDFDYVTGDNDNGRIIVTAPKSGQLELSIAELIPTDKANYTCKSRNVAGFAEQNGTIMVEFSPRFVDGQQTEFYGWAGKTRNMTCMTHAEPAPVIEWFHFGKLLETNQTYRILPLIKNSVLQVTVQEAEEIWMYNTYTCRARNAHGTNELQMRMNRAMEPGQPKLVEVTDETPTRLILSVTPPAEDGGMPVIGYRVEFDSVVSSFKVGDQIELENLRPSTSYVINVRAKNEVGVSIPFSLETKTKSLSKPYPLEIISDPTGLYAYEYSLKWEKPQTGGNSIKEYKFRIRQVKADPVTLDIINAVGQWSTRLANDEDMDNPMKSYLLRGLKPDTYYQIEVEAKNDIGWSETSQQFVFRTAQDPSIGAKGPDEEAINPQPVKSMTTAAVIGIVVSVFFIFLIIVDISCYFLNNCGVTKCLCVNVCGEPDNRNNKEKLMDAEKAEGGNAGHEEPEEDDEIDEHTPLKTSDEAKMHDVSSAARNTATDSSDSKQSPHHQNGLPATGPTNA